MSDEGPLVSTVVPTYYRNDRLREAIESVYDQRHRPIEVVIVDGSGEAHARPVAEEYDEAEYIAQKRDRGPHAARSAGAERSSGAYVQFLDDDDRLRPEKFDRQLPLFEGDVGVVYSGLRDEEWGTVAPEADVRGKILDHALRIRTFPCIPSTMLVRRDVLEELLPLRHRHGADDSGMKIELARRTEFEFVDEPLVVRGKPDETLSSSWAHIEGRWKLIEAYAGLYEWFPPDVRRTAVRQTHYREGRKRLEERAWSPASVLAFARAAYHTPEETPKYLAETAGSVFGRPGLRAVDRLADAFAGDR